MTCEKGETYLYVLSNRYKGKVALISKTRLIGGVEVKCVSFSIKVLEGKLSFSRHWWYNRNYSFNSKSWAPGFGAQAHENYNEQESNLRLPGRSQQLNTIFQSFAMSAIVFLQAFVPLQIQNTVHWILLWMTAFLLLSQMCGPWDYS